MTTILTLTAPLWRGLFDDAAIFPPGNTPMAQALLGHTSHRKSWYGATLGPFVCSDQRWPELTSALHGPPVLVALVVTGGISALQQAVETACVEPAVALHAVEVSAPVQALSVLDIVPDEVHTYLELPPSADLSSLRGSRHRAKFRTGGETAASADLLATAIDSCVRHQVAFKLTGGLHRAVAAPGRHGFLNVIAAVAAALDVAPHDVVAGVLAESEGIAERVRGFSDEQGRQIRRLFVSFGTCSITEPVDDLRTLGLA